MLFSFVDWKPFVGIGYWFHPSCIPPAENLCANRIGQGVSLWLLCVTSLFCLSLLLSYANPLPTMRADMFPGFKAELLFPIFTFEHTMSASVCVVTVFTWVIVGLAYPLCVTIKATMAGKSLGEVITNTPVLGFNPIFYSWNQLPTPLRISYGCDPTVLLLNCAVSSSFFS